MDGSRCRYAFAMRRCLLEEAARYFEAQIFALHLELNRQHGVNRRRPRLTCRQEKVQELRHYLWLCHRASREASLSLEDCRQDYTLTFWVSE